MQSSGGTISAKVAQAEPVRTVLSGPAGGVIGAYKMASLAGFGKIIGFDMGGTSTDVCLVDADIGGLHISSESVVSGIPIGVPMLDIHTAGAGGDRSHVSTRVGCFVSDLSQLVRCRGRSASE